MIIFYQEFRGTSASNIQRIGFTTKRYGKHDICAVNYISVQHGQMVTKKQVKISLTKPAPLLILKKKKKK